MTLCYTLRQNLRIQNNKETETTQINANPILTKETIMNSG